MSEAIDKKGVPLIQNAGIFGKSQLERVDGNTGKCSVIPLNPLLLFSSAKPLFTTENTNVMSPLDFDLYVGYRLKETMETSGVTVSQPSEEFENHRKGCEIYQNVMADFGVKLIHSSSALDEATRGKLLHSFMSETSNVISSWGAVDVPVGTEPKHLEKGSLLLLKVKGENAGELFGLTLDEQVRQNLQRVCGYAVAPDQYIIPQTMQATLSIVHSNIALLNEQWPEPNRAAHGDDMLKFKEARAVELNQTGTAKPRV